MGEIPIILQIAAVVFGPAGAAYIGVRTSLNGTREDVREIKRDLKEVQSDVSGLRERITRVETRSLNQPHP